VEGTLESQEGGTYGDHILCLKSLVLLYIVYLVPEKKIYEATSHTDPNLKSFHECKALNCVNNCQSMILCGQAKVSF
jgi:hypothetical protein